MTKYDGLDRADWQVRAEQMRQKDADDKAHLLANTDEWEPNYGFCATNETDRVALAMTLEALRRRACCYGGGDRCDCKYGLRVERGSMLNEFGVSPGDDSHNKWSVSRGTAGNSEQTGCPELREIIHRLLHRDFPLI